MPTPANAPETSFAIALPPELHRGVAEDCFRLHITPSNYAYAARLLRLQLKRTVGIDRARRQPFNIDDDPYEPPEPLGTANRGWLALTVCLGNIAPRRVLEADGARAGQSAEAYLRDSVHILHDLIEYDVNNPMMVSRGSKEPKEVGLPYLPRPKLNILRTGALAAGEVVGKVLGFNPQANARAGDFNNFGA